MSWTRWLAAAALAFVMCACGRDPAQVRWDDAFGVAMTQSRTDPRGAEAAFTRLAAEAPRAVDEGAARREVVRLMLADGRKLEAAELLERIAAEAPREDDRARAHYELARLAEDEGDRESAVRLYRSLVLHYPDLMPGERSLAHLLRIARAAGPAAVDEHLAWTRSISERLAHTGLADDLVFQAADEARVRAESGGDPGDWARAEELFQRLAAGPHTPLWNDAVWELSWLYHRQRRFREEVAAILAILRTREQLSLFGQDEHPYYYLGQLRLARLQLVELGEPRAAIGSYLRYAELFPRTIKKDDVRFFALCAALQAGDQTRADALAALLEREHPDSKYLRRVGPAFADARGPHCLPPEVTR